MSNTWCQILPGKAWDYLKPDPAVIDWTVIARVLARIPRFTGHTTSGPYCIAQHCVEGARAILRDTARRDWAAAFLLHDAHEFVIGDDSRPKIEALAVLVGGFGASGLKAAFCELKRRSDAVIYPAAGLPWPLPKDCAAVVHEYDTRMLRTEADACTGPRAAGWALEIECAAPVVGVDMSVWGESLATALWLSAARDLLPALGQPDAPAERACCEAPPTLSPMVPESWPAIRTCRGPGMFK